MVKSPTWQQTVSWSCEIGQRSTLKAPHLLSPLYASPSQQAVAVSHSCSLLLFLHLDCLLLRVLVFLRLTLQCVSSVSNCRRPFSPVALRLSLPLSDVHRVWRCKHGIHGCSSWGGLTAAESEVTAWIIKAPVRPVTGTSAKKTRVWTENHHIL